MCSAMNRFGPTMAGWPPGGGVAIFLFGSAGCPFCWLSLLASCNALASGHSFTPRFDLCGFIYWWWLMAFAGTSVSRTHGYFAWVIGRRGSYGAFISAAFSPFYRSRYKTLCYSHELFAIKIILTLHSLKKLFVQKNPPLW